MLPSLLACSFYIYNSACTLYTPFIYRSCDALRSIQLYLSQYKFFKFYFMTTTLAIVTFNSIFLFLYIFSDKIYPNIKKKIRTLNLFTSIGGEKFKLESWEKPIASSEGAYLGLCVNLLLTKKKIMQNTLAEQHHSKNAKFPLKYIISKSHIITLFFFSYRIEFRHNEPPCRERTRGAACGFGQQHHIAAVIVADVLIPHCTKSCHYRN